MIMVDCRRYTLYAIGKELEIGRAIADIAARRIGTEMGAFVFV